MLLAASTVVIRLLSEGIIDSGDGLQHFHIARASWTTPLLLLDHWGKPLFTLLASPFAQLGLWGMTLFNALCFMATCLAADGLLRRHGGAARWFFAPLLLLVPEYGRMVLAGMTEPLFGLLTMLVLRLLHDERWSAASIVASFMPFARPEYVAFLPLVAIWLMLHRRWRALPLLGCGYALYALLGALFLHDALWYLHRDPYTGAAGIYGAGSPLHFIRSLPETMGTPLLVLSAASMAVGIILWVKRPGDRPTLKLLAVLALLPSVAILATHSFMWWTGMKGSLGLTRVLATAAPLTVMVSLWPISALIMHSRWRPVARSMVLVGIGISGTALSVASFLRVTPLPFPLDDYQRFLKKAGARVSELIPTDTRLVYYHPLIAHNTGLSPYSVDRARQCWGLDFSAHALGLAPNELLVWDSHFGPNEGGTPLDSLLNRDDLVLAEMMVPQERITVLGGYPFEVWIFHSGVQRRNTMEDTVFNMNSLREGLLDWRADSIPCPPRASDLCLDTVMFPLEVRMPSLPDHGVLYTEFRVRGSWTIGVCDDQRFELVFAEEADFQRLTYWSWTVENGDVDLFFRVPQRSTKVNSKLYVWNNHYCAIGLNSLSVTRTTISNATPVIP